MTLAQIMGKKRFEEFPPQRRKNQSRWSDWLRAHAKYLDTVRRVSYRLVES